MRTFFTAPLVFLMIGCSASRSVVPLRQAFQDDLEAARRLIVADHLQQAVDELNLLLQMDPKNAEGYFLRGLAHQKREAFLEAVRDYEKTLTLDPRHARALYNLGMIHAFQTDNAPGAFKYLDAFLTRDPNHPEAFHAAKVMKSLDAGFRKFQEEDLERLMSRSQAMTDREQKKILLTQKIKNEPDSPISHFLLGCALDEEGKKKEARLSYEKALSLWPTCAPCHRALGRLLIRQKSAEEGRVHLRKAELFDPNESEGSIDTPARSSVR